MSDYYSPAVSFADSLTSADVGARDVQLPQLPEPEPDFEFEPKPVSEEGGNAGEVPASGDAAVGGAASRAEKSSARAATAKRRADKKLLEHYAAIAATSDEVREVYGVVLGLAGKKKTDPIELALEAANGTHDNDGLDVLHRLADVEHEVEQILEIIQLPDMSRSNVWKVLAAADAISGSPAPTDPAGTSKRLQDAIRGLDSQQRDLFAQVSALRHHR